MNNRDERKINAVAAWPRKAGKSDYMKYLNGERLTQRQSIHAKCYDCCCGEPDVCSVRHCPLLPYNLAIDNIVPAGSARTGPDSN